LYTVSGEVGAESDLVDTSLGEDVVLAGAGISLAKSVLNRTAILHAEGLRLRACLLTTVDAASAPMERAGWRECEISESRFTGARLNEAHLDDVVFQACRMNLVQCQLSKLRRCRFDECDLRGAYFNGSDLSGTTFEGSDLTGADLSGAILAGCDFRRAIIEDVRVAPGQLDGVIVSSDQALYLARLFGLDIRE
jgi:uncharacterized protein YjbI with pentapeptide repeats